MSDTPAIPFGYRQVTTAQKGDGIWDGTRFRKARKVWPSTEATASVIIRKCEVVQEALPIAEAPRVVECDWL